MALLLVVLGLGSTLNKSLALWGFVNGWAYSSHGLGFLMVEFLALEIILGYKKDNLYTKKAQKSICSKKFLYEPFVDLSLK